MLESPDQQVSLTDPDARSMATSGRGSGVVGYNVQVAVEAAHHLIVAHEVTNVGSDRSQLAIMAKQRRRPSARRSSIRRRPRLLLRRGILACEQAGITVTLPKPMTSDAKAEGRFGKQDFRYVPRRTSIAVLPVKGFLTTTRPRKMDSLTATGPAPARAAP